jgi:hypothetical protein
VRKAILPVGAFWSATASLASPTLPPESQQAYFVAAEFIKEINDAGAARASQHLYRDSFEWIGIDGRTSKGRTNFARWADNSLVSINPDNSDWRVRGVEHFKVEGPHGQEVFMPLTFTMCEKVGSKCRPGTEKSVRKMVRFHFEYQPGYLPPLGPPIRRMEIVR